MGDWHELERMRGDLSDLRSEVESIPRVPAVGSWDGGQWRSFVEIGALDDLIDNMAQEVEIGRASCRERV